MRIRIDDTDKSRQAVEDALAEVNGKARTHAITYWYEVQEVVERAEKALSNVATKDRAGATVTYTPPGPRAKAYNNSVRSTEITLVCYADGKSWGLTHVARVTVYPQEPTRLGVTLQPQALERHLRNIGRYFAGTCDKVMISVTPKSQETLAAI